MPNQVGAIRQTNKWTVLFWQIPVIATSFLIFFQFSHFRDFRSIIVTNGLSYVDCIFEFIS